MSVRAFVLVSAASALLAGCAAAPSGPVGSSAAAPVFDLVLRGGSIYDGSGDAPFTGDVAVTQDRIVAVAPRISGTGRHEVDATGLAVAPGFINMLSWATESLIEDGRSQSDIRQGVTLEVFGEGSSMGPLNPEMKRQEAEEQGDIRYPITWTSLGEYLTMLEKKGVSPNVASFVGATTVRIHELGRNDVDPTPAQLDRMRGLVRHAMNEGALGVGASLIYAPAYFAETPELIALASEAAKCGGLYISHIRDEMGRAEGSENMKLLVHEPDKVLLLAFKNPALKPLTGKTLADVARIRGKSAQETAADPIIEDHTRIQVAYFGMNEANVARQTSLPWVSFGSDASSQAPEGVFLKSSTHPRAYGNFARVLGKYARNEKRLSVQEAVRRLSAFPAANLGLVDRGALKPGYFADIVLFDPATIGDTATFEKPQSYAIGMRHVFVNGVQVLRDGEHVGATPGRFVKGRGAGKCPA